VPPTIVVEQHRELQRRRELQRCKLQRRRELQLLQRCHELAAPRVTVLAMLP